MIRKTSFSFVRLKKAGTKVEYSLYDGRIQIQKLIHYELKWRATARGRDVTSRAAGKLPRNRNPFSVNQKTLFSRGK